jgi:hypothetical protein
MHTLVSFHLLLLIQGLLHYLTVLDHVLSGNAEKNKVQHVTVLSSVRFGDGENHESEHGNPDNDFLDSEPGISNFNYEKEPEPKWYTRVIPGSPGKGRR